MRDRASALLLVILASAGCSILVSNELDEKGSSPTADAGHSEGGKQDVDAEGSDGDASVDGPLSDGPCGQCNDDCCEGECVDLMTDEANCGTCGHACPAGRACEQGTCASGFAPVSTSGAPDGRVGACAAWTGREMFVWGGLDAAGTALQSGGAYDPVTDTWRGVTALDAPEARDEPTCVAMGERVFVWGGMAEGQLLDTGAVWDAKSNTWHGIGGNNTPPARIRAMALWTGDEVLVWGGEKLDAHQERTGGLFNPGTNEWRTISVDNAPAQNRQQSWAWSGSTLYVFGGRDSGGNKVTAEFHSYDAEQNAWTPIESVDELAPRSSAFAAWTTDGFAIWGGLGDTSQPLDSGGIFYPAKGTWAPLDPALGPPARALVLFKSGWCAWTGSSMLVAGGVLNLATVFPDLYLFQPDAGPVGTWQGPISWEPPTLHDGGVGVWTGEEFIIWGGTDGILYTDSGTRWRP